ncbi:LPXTG cell wall anchor domain-containing protein [uncultured Gemella sp.]|uniref:LPXTG cell wall anchor domain-containing protein n=1 Tax=uncultured Gemella sp. TaxID=254352 RepID=UPI0028E3308F|nr:LPXTG cell wall anchor domain-containing protein [uncultured Gemella sp.]
MNEKNQHGSIFKKLREERGYKLKDVAVDVAPGELNNKPELQRPRVNSNGLNTLPNTGESQTGTATVAGLVALAVAVRLRKNKENN